MELFHVGSVTEFKGVDGQTISYLVHHDWRDGKHYSYGFDPNKMDIDVAMRNFQTLLDNNTATPFNPDGGRLDGSDLT